MIQQKKKQKTFHGCVRRGGSLSVTSTIVVIVVDTAAVMM